MTLARRLAQPAVVLLSAVVIAVAQFIAGRNLSLRAFPDAGVVAANAYGLSRGSGRVAPSSFFEQVTSAQLAGYARLTGAFSRHDGLAGVLHEYVIVMVALGTIALIILGRLLGVALVGCVAAAALVFLTPAMAGVQALGPAATVASAWALLGFVLLAIRPESRALLVLTVLVAVLAFTAAVLTAPVSVLLPVTFAGGLVATATVGARWLRPLRALVLLGFVVGLGWLGWLTVEGPWQVIGPALPAGTDPWLAIGGVLVAGLALWRLSWLRPLALTTVAMLAAMLWSSPVQATALVLVAPLTAILAVELLAQVLDQVRAASPRAHRRLVLPVVGVLAATALVAAVLLLPTDRAGADGAHTRLADWVGHNTASTTVVAVQPVLWAELVHDGLPETRLAIEAAGSAGQIRATAAPGDQGNALLASFGGGADALAVRVAPEGGAAAVTAALRGTLAQRRFGTALSVNPNIISAAPVQESLRTGKVDPRLLTVLAGAAAVATYSLTDLPSNSGDAADGGALREAEISAADEDLNRLSDFFALQLPAYKPLSIARSGSTLRIVYSVPSPVGLIG